MGRGGSDLVSLLFPAVFLRPLFLSRLGLSAAPADPSCLTALRSYNTAPREADILPWSHVAVDTIGPWVLKVYNREERFYTLTIIDMVTNLTEIVRLDNRTSAHAATMFTNTWLARYPKPTTCIYDQGSEFIGWPFQHMLTQYDIQR
jgi:transposase InsO family protein